MMTITRFSALDRLVDDVMHEVTGTAFGLSRAGSFSPEIDVRSNDKEIVFSIDVPGIKREQLDITLENGVLSLRGTRKYEGDPGDKVWLGKSYGAFARSFNLPDHVESDKLYAELADGVLTVRIPRAEKSQPRRIPISGSGEKQLKDENK